MPVRTIVGVGRWVIGAPSKRIAPDDAVTRPMMVLSNVLLPAPFAPMSATISPAATESDTSCRTGERP